MLQFSNFCILCIFHKAQEREKSTVAIYYRAAIVSDFIRRVRIFLGKTPAKEFLSQNTDNARAASEPSYGKDRGPIYRVALDYYGSVFN